MNENQKRKQLLHSIQNRVEMGGNHVALINCKAPLGVRNGWANEHPSVS